MLDSAPGIKRCANFALSQLGYPPIPYKELDFFIGPPLKDCFRLCGVKEGDLEKAMRIFRGEYEARGGFEAIVYPFVKETLEELKRKGHPLYVCTSKIQTTSKPILRHFGLDSYFDGIYGASQDGRRSKKGDVIAFCLQKEGLSQNETVMVGDTELDVLGAKQNKLDCIVADYGYGDRMKIEESRPSAYLKRFSDLLAILD